MSNSNTPVGFKAIVESPDGRLVDCPASWGGALAMLLRKILVDNYDGKGLEGHIPQPDERMSQAKMESIIEETVTQYSQTKLTRTEINSIKSSLMKEFSREFLSVKYLGEYFHIIDAEWVDFTVVLNRKSGTIKSYTVHIGGLGTEQYNPPKYTNEHYNFYKTHNMKLMIEEPSTLVKKTTVAGKKLEETDS